VLSSSCPGAFDLSKRAASRVHQVTRTTAWAAPLLSAVMARGRAPQPPVRGVGPLDGTVDKDREAFEMRQYELILQLQDTILSGRHPTIRLVALLCQGQIQVRTARVAPTARSQL